MSDIETMPESQKYRAFRNYMVNELGITRQDIKSWTMQSVANEVEKMIGQLNIDSLVSEAINKSAHAAVNGSRYGSGNGLRDKLAKLLAERISVDLRNPDPKKEAEAKP